ncbi:MAG TPA: hypothetical protein VFW44_22660 [Bryobacteraceae bacterium]|nr:hypothetical protein [Bryobacteraceae bacterium]
MNDDLELLDALRALASEGPREAPPDVEERLKREFRRVNRRRNLVTWVPALSAAAALAIALFLWTHRDTPQPAAALSSQVSSQAVAPVAEEEGDAGFYPLPEAEALPAVENAMVIRVQMPVSSLQLMGVPVASERAGTSVAADLLLGQDGLARGVRLAE